MISESIPVNPAIVRWARQRSGYSLEAASEHFRNIADWEAGESLPTYPQLERMADAFKTPIAVFFFPEPPQLPPIEETFRTLDPSQFARIPPRIRLLLRKAQAFQLGLFELNDGVNPSSRLITRDLSFSPKKRATSIAAEIRNYLGISIEEQFGWSDPATALEEWRNALLRVGVYVFKDQFREPEYSGFCLYDDQFPIIYVNNTTTKTRQIFTVFHELAHLLFHTSGVDTLTDSYLAQLSGDPRRIEVICNQVAAHVLVPESLFDEEFSGKEANEESATQLADVFGVSRELIFRKFLDRGLISNEAYETAAKKWSKQVRRGKGGNHYNTKISYLGKEYINLAFKKYYQNRINFNQLADYLDTKPKNLIKLEEYISRRAP